MAIVVFLLDSDLRQYGSLIGVPSSLETPLEIVDPGDAHTIILKLPSFSRKRTSRLKASKVVNIIGVAKNKKLSPATFGKETTKGFSDDQRLWISQVWR